MKLTRSQLLYVLIALGLPAFVVGYANAMFAYNHFYERGAYMMDAGWLSTVIYRNGVLLPNPLIADARPYFFDVHVCLLFVVESLVSYVVPLDRVDYYVLTQGLTHAPLGLAAGLLLPPERRPRSLAGITFVGLVGVAFGMNGQAFACMGYPHFELFLICGICIMLAALVTGRTRLAWVGLVMAIITREDGGAHAATFLAAVFACGALGRPFPVPRPTLVRLLGVALGSTVLMVVAQRSLAHGEAVFRHVYLGQPAFAHLSGPVIWARIGFLVEHTQYVTWSIGAVAVVAMLDRDGRWLLGWAAGIPWFVLNLIAWEELKSQFSIYTGFPFVASLFWVGAYGILKYGPRAFTLTGLALCSVLVTCGVYVANPGYFLFENDEMEASHVIDVAVVRTYARALGDHERYGRMLADPAIASLALESLDPAAILRLEPGRRDLDHWEALSFNRWGIVGEALFDTIARGRFSQCGELPSTTIVYCTHPERPLPSEFKPFSVFMDPLNNYSDSTRLANGHWIVDAGKSDHLALYGPMMKLAPGRYRATVDLRVADACTAPVHLQAYVFSRLASLGEADVTVGAGPQELEFTVLPDQSTEKAEVRFFHSACRYEIASFVINDANAPQAR